MQRESAKRDCTAVIGSLTQAIRAQKVLTEAAVFSQVVKADAASTGRGCAYGIHYACKQEPQVLEALRRAKIHPRSGRNSTP